ncbi:MAG: outer membrane protein assembly factor BamC [Burkholderiales bacterium]
MNYPKLTSIVTSVALLAALAGCDSMPVLEGKKIDYKSAGKLPPLELPPDLTVPNSDDRYAVPDVSASGTATFSAYSKERGGQVQAKSSNLLPEQDKVRIQREGNERWLVVQAKPEAVWPVVKEFWQENGFIIKTELPEAGIMETDWAENRAKIPMDPIRSILSKVVDSLYSTPERDKFRTRLERGSVPGTTEIYISHRGMYEVIQGGDGGTGTIWEPRQPDPELEAEMLRRLMVRFGVQESRSRAMLAAEALPARATVTKGADGQANLSILDPFDRAWRRVGLALDRVGFTVEDRDRSKGLYYVRYIDPETDGQKTEKSFLGKLAFWNGHAKTSQQKQYVIHISETSGTSRVEVRDKAGTLDKSETANKILNLLYEQLK